MGVQKTFSWFLIEISCDFQIKDAPAFLAISSNEAGSSSKDLFDDVIDDLEKQVVDVVYFPFMPLELFLYSSNFFEDSPRLLSNFTLNECALYNVYRAYAAYIRAH